MQEADVKDAVLKTLAALKAYSKLSQTKIDDTIVGIIDKVLGNEDLLDMLIDLLGFGDDDIDIDEPDEPVLAMCEVRKIDWQKLLELVAFIFQIIGPFLLDEDEEDE